MPVLLAIGGSALGGAWVAATSHCPSHQEVGDYSRPIVCWACFQALALHRRLPRTAFLEFKELEQNQLFIHSPIISSSIFRLPLWYFFSQELWSNETIKQFKHYAWTVYQENNHRKRSWKFAQWIFQCGEEGKEMAMGRLRFPLETLINWTELGWSFHLCTCAHNMRPYASCCLCRIF